MRPTARRAATARRRRQFGRPIPAANHPAGGGREPGLCRATHTAASRPLLAKHVLAGSRGATGEWSVRPVWDETPQTAVGSQCSEWDRRQKVRTRCCRFQKNRVSPDHIRDRR